MSRAFGVAVVAAASAVLREPPASERAPGSMAIRATENQSSKNLSWM